MLPQYMPFPTSLFHSIPYLSTFIVLTKPVSADQVFLALFALRKWDTFILTWDSNFPCASDIWWIEEGVVRRQDRTSLMYVYHHAYTGWGIKGSIYTFVAHSMGSIYRSYILTYYWQIFKATRFRKNKFDWKVPQTIRSKKFTEFSSYIENCLLVWRKCSPTL